MRGLVACVVLVSSAAVAGCGSSGNKTDGGGGWWGWRRGRHRRRRGDRQLWSVHRLRRQHRGDLALRVRVRAFSSATCPTETTLTTPAPGLTATYTFGSGGVFTYTFSGTLNETVNFALGCLAGLTDAGVPQACADLQNLFRTAIGQDAGSSTTQIVSATCSAGQNETCNCTLVFSAHSVTTQGTYTISGTRVTITDPDGGADASTPVDYCVSGNTLTLRLADDAGKRPDHVEPLTANSGTELRPHGVGQLLVLGQVVVDLRADAQHRPPAGRRPVEHGRLDAMLAPQRLVEGGGGASAWSRATAVSPSRPASRRGRAPGGPARPSATRGRGPPDRGSDRAARAGRPAASPHVSQRRRQRHHGGWVVGSDPVELQQEA